jgi:hypothetical protein
MEVGYMGNKSRVLVLASLAGCLAWPSAPMSAHHGTNQSYDRSAPVTVKGVVTDFRYKNPHPQLFIDVTDNDGKVTAWAIEIAPTPYTLALRGWSKKRSDDALKPGTAVNVSLAPSVAGTPVGLLRSITSEAGTPILGDLEGALRTGPE